MGKDKMVQIYEAMADMTLGTLEFLRCSKDKKENYGVILNEDILKMVHTTQSLYETINYANQSEITTAAISTDCRDVEKEVGINPLKY